MTAVVLSLSLALLLLLLLLSQPSNILVAAFSSPSSSSYSSASNKKKTLPFPSHHHNYHHHHHRHCYYYHYHYPTRRTNDPPLVQSFSQTSSLSSSTSTTTTTTTTALHMVFYSDSKNEAFIEQASTQDTLDSIVDECLRMSGRRPIMIQFEPSSKAVRHIPSFLPFFLSSNWIDWMDTHIFQKWLISLSLELSPPRPRLIVSFVYSPPCPWYGIRFDYDTLLLHTIKNAI
jgi:hypothetical protein